MQAKTENSNKTPHLTELLTYITQTNLNNRSNKKLILEKFNNLFNFNKELKTIKINTYNQLLNLTNFLFKKDKLNILMLLTELVIFFKKEKVKEFHLINLNDLWLEITELFVSIKSLSDKIKLNYALLSLRLKQNNLEKQTTLISEIKKLLKSNKIKVSIIQKNNIFKYLDSLENKNKKTFYFNFDLHKFKMFVNSLNPIVTFFSNKYITEVVSKIDLIEIYGNLLNYNFRIVGAVLKLRNKLLEVQIVVDDLIIFLYLFSGDYFNAIHFINRVVNCGGDMGNPLSDQIYYRYFYWQILIENYANKSFMQVNMHDFKENKLTQLYDTKDITNIKNYNSFIEFYTLKEKELSVILPNSTFKSSSFTLGNKLSNNNIKNINNINNNSINNNNIKKETLFYNTHYKLKLTQFPLINSIPYFYLLTSFINKKLIFKDFETKFLPQLNKYKKNIYYIYKLNDSKLKLINIFFNNNSFIIENNIKNSITKFFSLLSLNHLVKYNKNKNIWFNEKSLINKEILLFLSSWKVSSIFNQNINLLDIENSIFIFSKELYNVPVENFIIFKDMKIKRLLSLEFLIGKLNISNNHVYNENNCCILVILDNSEDLKNTHDRIKPFLKKHNLKFYISIDEVPLKILLNTETLIYFGHGNGKKGNKNLLNFKLHNQQFKNMKTIFLFGCSSLKLLFVENFQHNFIINEFIKIFPGLQMVIGTLWDVTDRDIDILSLKILDDFLSDVKNKMISNLSYNKDFMRFKGLNGAAVIVYGF
ncbi:Separin [Cucumispora dikerogammari]|nr:Separin [Cucumispora dikerogammari]